jgi:hypothetical protein
MHIPIYLCHQKHNPASETVPLNVKMADLLRAGRLGDESVGGAALLTCPAANTVTASLSVPPYSQTRTGHHFQ